MEYDPFTHILGLKMHTKIKVAGISREMLKNSTVSACGGDKIT